jgi:hypothetical protein
MAWARVISCDVTGGGRQGAGRARCVGHKLGQSSYVEHIGGAWELDDDICEGHP